MKMTCKIDRPSAALGKTHSPFEPCVELEVSAQGAGPSLDCGLRSASATRQIAIALDRNPVPEFSNSKIEARWQVGPDTVRKVLRTFGVDPGLQKGALTPLTDLLFCEGDSDPIKTWITASDRQREILAANLLTLEEWKKHLPLGEQKHATTHYRRLNTTTDSIRIGKQHRFRIDTIILGRILPSRYASQ